METWKPVTGYEALYEVSDLGRIRSMDRICQHKNGATSTRRGRILKPALRAGYPFINLCLDGIHRQVHVHRLVAEAFCPKEPGNEVVNHLDGDKTNNHAANLEWTTHQGNAAHAFASGLNRARHGEESHSSKLTADQVAAIRTSLINGETGVALAEKHGVHVMTISNIRNARSWREAETDDLAACQLADRKLSHKGEEHPSHILTERDVEQIIRRLIDKEQQKMIAFEFGVHPVAISNINNGLAWNHVRVAGCGEPPYYRRSAKRQTKVR